MIKVRDWIASIPDEEKHIAYVGEGQTEQREFLLCGEDWKTYRDWAFHLDMAFDPTSITTRDTRQVVQTTVNSTEQTDEKNVITDEITTKETFTVHDVQVTNHNLTDIAPLSKSVTTDGIRLVWTVLRQHTVLPGKLWATIRAVDGEGQRIKKSAIMVFEVDPAICAVPAAVPPISEFEQMTTQMDSLRLQTEAAAEQAVRASNNANGAAYTIFTHLEAGQQAASDAMSAAQNATASAEEAIRASTSATIAADGALNHFHLTIDAADKATAAVQDAAASADEAIRASTSATIAADGALNHFHLAIDAADQASAAVKNAAASADEAIRASTSATIAADGALANLQLAVEAADNAQAAAAEAKATVQTTLNAAHNRINVRDYGAVGDGVTNDQPAIWTAWQAAKALILQDIPCELYFPAGIYGILEGGFGFAIPKGKGGLRITGAGRETTTIQYLADWQPNSKYGGSLWYAIDVSPESSPEHWNYDTYIHDVAISGLTIRDDYPDKHATHTAKGTATTVYEGEENHGINIGYCVRAAVTDCNLINLGDEVVDIYSCEDTIVMNNHVEGCPAAGPGGGAITIADGSKGAVVSGNTIVRSGADYVLTAEDFGGADGITLKAGVQMSGRVKLPDGTVIERYTVLSEDTYIPVGTTIIKSNYAVAVESLYTPVRDVVITGNTIRDMHGKAMNLACPNAGSSIDNVIIAENVMVGCDMGVNLSGTHPKRGVKIQNNIISDCLNEAVLTTAVEDITISGNTFRNIKGSYAVHTAGYGPNSRQLIGDNVFENIENMAVFCNGTTMIKDCLFNGVGTTETPLATKKPAIDKAGGTLTVSGCVMKDIRRSGVKSGIQGADYVEHTNIELITDGVANAGGDALTYAGTVIGGKIGGRITITQDNAIVQGVSIVSSNIGSQAISVNANGVSVTGCNINLSSGTYPAIKEADGKNHNLFANNIVNRGITTVGAQSVAVNNIDTRTTA